MNIIKYIKHIYKYIKYINFKSISCYNTLLDLHNIITMNVTNSNKLKYTGSIKKELLLEYLYIINRSDLGENEKVKITNTLIDFIEMDYGQQDIKYKELKKFREDSIWVDQAQKT